MLQFLKRYVQTFVTVKQPKKKNTMVDDLKEGSLLCDQCDSKLPLHDKRLTCSNSLAVKPALDQNGKA